MSYSLWDAPAQEQDEIPAGLRENVHILSCLYSTQMVQLSAPGE